MHPHCLPVAFMGISHLYNVSLSSPPSANAAACAGEFLAVHPDIRLPSLAFADAGGGVSYAVRQRLLPSGRSGSSDGCIGSANGDVLYYKFDMCRNVGFIQNTDLANVMKYRKTVCHSDCFSFEGILLFSF